MTHLSIAGGLVLLTNSGKDVVKTLGECRVVDYLEFGREKIWPDSFPIWHPLKCFCHRVHGWFIFERQVGQSRESSFSDFVFQEVVAKPRPSFANSHLVP